MDNTESQIYDEDPFEISDEIRNKVLVVLCDYRTIKKKAQKELLVVTSDDINLKSASAMSDTPSFTAGRVSNPVENVVIDIERKNEKILSAREAVAAVDNGILEACSYANYGQKKDITYSLRKMMLSNEMHFSEVPAIVTVSTLKKYYKMALFFIAYFLGYISDEEVVRRNIPKKPLRAQSDKPKGELKIWEKYDDEIRQSKISRSQKWKNKRLKRIEKNRKQKEQKSVKYCVK